jgi:hypothetical protein
VLADWPQTPQEDARVEYPLQIQNLAASLGQQSRQDLGVISGINRIAGSGMIAYL